MRYILILSAIIVLVSCKNNKELDILEDKAPTTELKSQNAHMQAAIKFMQKGNVDEALKELTQCIRTYHNEEAYVMKTNILLQEKRYFEFLENTEDALRFEEFQTPTMIMQNGLGYELTGQEDKAEEFYKQAVFRWTVIGTDERNYRTVLTQKPFLTTVLFGKQTGLKDFDNIFEKYAQNKQDTVIRNQFRPLLQTYDGTGMSYFYNEIEKNPTQ